MKSDSVHKPATSAADGAERAIDDENGDSGPQTGSSVLRSDHVIRINRSGDRIVRERTTRFRAALVAATLVLSLWSAPAANAYTERGAIKTEYDRLGGARVLGQPLFDERAALDGGRFQEFSGGSSIYWHPTRTKGAARQVGGAIRSKWSQLGYERGWLGYPITSETSTRKPGRFNHFENGSIYWSSATGAHAVKGQIYETWAATTGRTGRTHRRRNDWEDGTGRAIVRVASPSIGKATKPMPDHSCSRHDRVAAGCSGFHGRRRSPNSRRRTRRRERSTIRYVIRLV